MKPSEKQKLSRILDEMTCTEKSHHFLTSGIYYAIYNGAGHDAVKDMVETALELHRYVVIEELIGVFHTVFTQSGNGKPPSTTKLIEIFNAIITGEGEVLSNITKYRDRFVSMVETLSTKRGSK